MLSDCAPSPWGDTTAILIAAPPAAEPGSTCEHCQQPFQQHRGKRFCSSKCRVAFHNANRKTSQAPQMSQASQVETPKRLTETLTETPKRLIGLPPDHDETSAPKVADEFDWGDPGGLMCEEQQAVVAYRNDNATWSCGRKLIGHTTKMTPSSSSRREISKLSLIALRTFLASWGRHEQQTQ
jgi:hypothetical protein